MKLNKSIYFFFVVFLCLVSLIACSPKSEPTEASPAAVDESATTSPKTTEAAPKPTDSKLSALAASKDPVFVAGKAVYNRNCVACHQANGKGIPPAFPSIANSAVVTGDLDTQINLVLNGVSGSAMVAFGPQLSDEEIAAVITYQRNAFGNETGKVVTPEQIAALR